MLSEIVLDERLQARAGLNQGTVEQYSERMQAGDEFPPLTIVKVKGVNFLVDGGHRYHAAKRVGLESLPVQICHGTWQDAVRRAIQANHTHGLARSNEDKRRAVELALAEFAEQSDHALAALCGVSQTMVSRLRHELKSVVSSTKRVGRDGKARKLPKKPASDARGGTYAKEDAHAGRATDGNTAIQESSKAGPKEAQEDSFSEPACKHDDFRVGKAWELVEQFLLDEHKKWPNPRRRSLGDRLKKFAVDHCD